MYVSAAVALQWLPAQRAAADVSRAHGSRTKQLQRQRALQQGTDCKYVGWLEIVQCLFKGQVEIAEDSQSATSTTGFEMLLLLPPSLLLSLFSCSLISDDLRKGFSDRAEHTFHVAIGLAVMSGIAVAGLMEVSVRLGCGIRVPVCIGLVQVRFGVQGSSQAWGALEMSLTQCTYSCSRASP